jgi:hypothetical protein
MNDKLIDNTIQDYSLRELQIYSSKILSVCGATNSFIKQFKADNDSHQFYKNVIKWYVKTYQKFPEEEPSFFIFKFLVNEPGLGDRFVMTSNILYTMKELEPNNHFIVDMYCITNKGTPSEQLLNFEDFYDVIDFFHFERPSTPIISNVIRDKWAVKEEKKDRRFFSKRKNTTGNVDCINYNMKNKIYEYNNIHLFKLGKYWPINYDKTIKKDIVTFMFYIKDDLKHAGDGEKWITLEQEKAFKRCSKISNFVRLKDLDYAKNVELLSRSSILIASEGMWTHLSRAMGVYTIAYTKAPAFIEEINYQGHFCSENFEECLTKLKEKCTNLTK